jgi:hypothetical protein
MHIRESQGKSELDSHSCEHCKAIVINGTKRGNEDVTQDFQYILEDVQSYAHNCLLFQWALQLPQWNINAQACLVLSISTDSEDLAFLDAQWQNCPPSLATEGEMAEASLSIFAQKGSLKWRMCLPSANECRRRCCPLYQITTSRAFESQNS